MPSTRCLLEFLQQLLETEDCRQMVGRFKTEWLNHEDSVFRIKALFMSI